MLTNPIPEGFTSAGDENGTCPDPPENVFLVGGVRLKVKQGVKESGACVKFSPPGGARQRMSSDILYATTSDTDSDQL